MNWIPLTDKQQLGELVELSKSQSVLIFKHSTRCIISKMALRNFEDGFQSQGSVIPYFLDLIVHRELSNAIAENFNIQHQSPQLLVIKNGGVVYHESHEGIYANVLQQYL